MYQHLFYFFDYKSFFVKRPLASQSRPGFTFIELLVVTTITAVFIALLFPVLEQVREGVSNTKCSALQDGGDSSSAQCNAAQQKRFLSESETLIHSSKTISVAPESQKAWRQAAIDRPRQVIFDNDGAERVLLKEISREALLDKRTSGLEKTQVDTIFYCTNVGVGQSTRASEVWSPFVAKKGRYTVNILGDLLEAELDPMQVMTSYAHDNDMEIFMSVRMNDTHDGGSTYGKVLFEFNPFKQDHPDALLGAARKTTRYGRWSGASYSHSATRESVYDFVREGMENYDLDGVHLDFFRHPVFFPSTARGQLATKQELDLMSELICRIRNCADEVGRRRDRPMLVSIRVPDSVEYCRAIGLDIERWLADDLVDLLCVSGYFQLNDWDYSVALGKKHDVPVYPSLDESRVPDPEAKKSRNAPESYRARAMNVWNSGANGVLVFNYFNPKGVIWKELGDPTKLKTLDRTYFASVRGVRRAAGGNYPYAKMRTHETLNPGSPKAIPANEAVKSRIVIGEKCVGSDCSKVQLRLRFKYAPQPEQVSVELNDQKLTATRINDQWLQCNLLPDSVRAGKNIIQVRNRSDENPLTWLDAELKFTPGSGH